MKYTHTTFVPNYVFDSLLPKLTFAEVKVLLVIIRQTNGWVCKKTGGRKKVDRISHSQFMKKAKLSRRSVSATIASLAEKGLIEISNGRGIILNDTHDRQGQILYYSVPKKLPHLATYAMRRKALCEKFRAKGIQRDR